VLPFRHKLSRRISETNDTLSITIKLKAKTRQSLSCGLHVILYSTEIHLYTYKGCRLCVPTLYYHKTSPHPTANRSRYRCQFAIIDNIKLKAQK